MPKTPDIMELGRRWQKAWTSYRPNASNSIGDAFGQLTDEIVRLRIILGGIRETSARMAEDDGLWFRAATCAEAYLQQELRKLCAAIEGISPDDCARAVLKQEGVDAGLGEESAANERTPILKDTQHD